MSSRNWWLVVGAALAVLAVVATVVFVASRDDGPTTPPALTTSTRPTTPEPVAPLTGPALAVKIDNAPTARPQTGLGSAEVVYVEPVEGGMTRLVAVYTGTPPPVVGPVRSARRTDVELLAQYGRPVFAYSGAAPELLPTLHAATVVNASPSAAAAAYVRDGDRAAPHNLYVRPGRLPDGATAPAVAPLRFGPAPVAGTPVTTHRVRYRTADLGVTWSPGDGRWLLSMNGSPLRTTDSGQVRASTVVVQQVQVVASEPGEDTRAGGSPVAHTVGGGTAVVLRDGQSFTVTWSRPTAESPTTFLAADGRELPLAPGPVWVLLTPA